MINKIDVFEETKKPLQLEFPIPRCIKPIEQSLLIPLGVNK